MAKGSTEDFRGSLEKWQDPSSLQWLDETPINCLVIPWAAGKTEDREQWRALEPLARAAAAKGLAVIGWVEEEADTRSAAEAAATAGLAGVATRNPVEMPGLAVIPWASRSRTPWDSRAPALILTDNVWPGVHGQQDGTASAGPTGQPWVESNAWLAELAKVRTEKPVWLFYEPPEGTIVRPQGYIVALMDAEAVGGRWIVSLDESTRKAIAKGNAGGAEVLRQMVRVLRFFEKHREWRCFRSLAVVGVLSDFSESNFESSGEVLKLTARRGLLTRPLYEPVFLKEGFTGLKAIVRFGTEPPSNNLRKSLLEFVSGGGLLISGPSWQSGGKPAAKQHPRFEIREYGRGRIAVARQEIVDHYEAAIDIHGLVSRANDLVRLFNTAASGGLFYTGSADGKKALLQLVHYTGRGRGLVGGATPDVSVWLRKAYKRVRMWSLESEEAVELKPLKAEGGFEYHLPMLPAYAAIELGV